MQTKNTSDLLSIIITAYNEEKYIKRAILSIFQQTYKNIELIIVDDGSTDNTLSVIHQTILENEKTVILTNTKPTGLMAARNFGVTKATGKYISFLDGDDTWDKRKAEVQLHVLRSLKEDSILFCGRTIFPIKGRAFIKKRVSISGNLLKFNHNQILCMKTGVSLGATLMMERAFFNYLGGLDNQVGKERDLNARAALHSGQVYWLGLPLYNQHVKPNSMSTNYSKMFEREKKMINAWKPSNERSLKRKISIEEYEKYRDSMYSINSRSFLNNHIDLPNELMEHSKKKKSSYRAYIFMRNIKQRLEQCLFLALYAYYNKFSNRIIEKVMTEYDKNN